MTLAQADIYETVCKQWNTVPVKDTTLDTLLKELRAVKQKKRLLTSKRLNPLQMQRLLIFWIISIPKRQREKLHWNWSSL